MLTNSRIVRIPERTASFPLELILDENSKWSLSDIPDCSMLSFRSAFQSNHVFFYWGENKYELYEFVQLINLAVPKMTGQAGLTAFFV